MWTATTLNWNFLSFWVEIFKSTKLFKWIWEGCERFIFRLGKDRHLYLSCPRRLLPLIGYSFRAVNPPFSVLCDFKRILHSAPTTSTIFPPYVVELKERQWVFSRRADISTSSTSIWLGCLASLARSRVKPFTGNGCWNKWNVETYYHIEYNIQ